MRRGKRLAIDYGQSRIGLAICDEEAILASPLATIQASSPQDILYDYITPGLLEIYVGLPTNLRGENTASTIKAVDFAQIVQSSTGVPVRLIDERLTTALSISQLQSVGKSPRDSKSIIDQWAAVAILEAALNFEKRTGEVPGISLDQWKLEND
ncbi:MAG: Holliday junction resolvase RuvX [Rhodoluna sp.]